MSNNNHNESDKSEIVDIEDEISEEESEEINSILGDTDRLNCTYSKVLIIN